MAIRQTLWTTTNKLECVPCPDDTAPVIICLPALFVNYYQCPLQPVIPPEITPTGSYAPATINGTVLNFSFFPPCSYRYTIEFDDAQLLPNVVMSPSDILGVICRDCHTMYVDDKAGNEVKLEILTTGNVSVYKLTTQHGCVFQFLTTEEVISQITVPANVGTTAQYYDITSILLTAGQWELSGAIDYNVNGATLASPRVSRAGISSSSGNDSSNLVPAFNLSNGPIPASSNGVTIIVPTHQVTLTANTLYYLKGYVEYTAGQPQSVGTLRARRIM